MALMQRRFFDSKPEQPLDVMQAWCKAGPEQSSRFEDILNTDGRTNKDTEIFVTVGQMTAYKFKKVANVSSGRGRKGVLMQSYLSSFMAAVCERDKFP